MTVRVKTNEAWFVYPTKSDNKKALANLILGFKNEHIGKGTYPWKFDIIMTQLLQSPYAVSAYRTVRIDGACSAESVFDWANHAKIGSSSRTWKVSSKVL